jgi:hypothetical protein
MAARLRGAILVLLGRVASPLMIRLSLGRPAGRGEAAAFAQGFADQTIPVPPLLRGTLAVPGARDYVMTAALADGTLPVKPLLDRLLALPGGHQMMMDATLEALGDDIRPLLGQLRMRPGGRDILVAAALNGLNGTLPAMIQTYLATEEGRTILMEAADVAWHWRDGETGPPDLGGNIYTAWTKPGISFLHIEKCGGVAAVRFLSRHFHPRQIFEDDRRDLPPHLMFRAPQLSGVDPAQTPFIWGHYDLPTLRRFAPAHCVFTVLREPKARVLSLYHFWRSVDPDQFDPDESFSVALAHRLTLEEFLECDDPMLVDLIDNLFLRRLTGLYATGAAADPVKANPEAALAQAMAALDGLDFVGLTERMDESMAAFAAQLGIDPPAAAVRANVTAENHDDPSGWFRKVARPALSNAATAALERRTSLDAVIYEKVSASFSGEKEAKRLF